MGMASNDSLLRLIGKNVQIECPSLSRCAEAREALQNRIVLLFFSAYNCHPCREFTPLLLHLYKQLKLKGDSAEILFCSKDKCMSQFLAYTASMPWWSLSPDKHSIVQRNLSCYYGVQAIPHLVVIGMDGAVIVNDAVSHVRNDPTGESFPWHPPPLNDVLPIRYLSSNATGALGHLQDLRQKYVFLYFAAGWSPECLQFTPYLSEAYDQLKARRDDFEFLFVSSDYEQSAFDAFWNEMSFGAIPFEDRGVQAALSARLGVKGIPTLVVLGPVDPSTHDRPVINTNARACIEKPDFLETFPYTPTRSGDFNRLDENINNLRALIVFYECGDDSEQSHLKQTIEAASGQCHAAVQRFYWATESTQMTIAFREALRLGDAKLQKNPCMVLVDFLDGGSFYVQCVNEVTVASITDFLSSPGERRQL